MKRNSTKHKANSPTLTLLILAGFLFLAQYAVEKHPPVHELTANEQIGAILDAHERERPRPVELHRVKVDRPHAFKFSKDEPDDVFGAMFEACEKNPKCMQPAKGKKL